jgi:hypothetical protein
MRNFSEVLGLSINKNHLVTFDEAHVLISNAIRGQVPFAAGKLGGTETRAIFHTDRFFQPEWPYSLSWLKYARQLYLLSGVFPVDKTTFKEFADHYRFEALPEIDYMFLWQEKLKEILLAKRHAKRCLFSFGYFPEFQKGSWLQSLEGKRVLVVSPFAKSIHAQYEKREAIWKAIPGLLPAFELQTLKCPLYSHLVPPEHPSWMATLQFLFSQCDSLQYDVLIAGAGAWGLPLAVHAKRRGKVGVHMGGTTQLVFGIKGARWDHAPELQNDAWVYPSQEETPNGVEQIEGACYWKAN